MHTNWVSSGLVASDILGGFDFAPIGFEMSYSILLMASSSDFLYSSRNLKISAGLNFSSGTLVVNIFTSRSTLSASSF
jgi:hypothetical protein